MSNGTVHVSKGSLSNRTREEWVRRRDSRNANDLIVASENEGAVSRGLVKFIKSRGSTCIHGSLDSLRSLRSLDSLRSLRSLGSLDSLHSLDSLWSLDSLHSLH